MCGVELTGGCGCAIQRSAARRAGTGWQAARPARALAAALDAEAARRPQGAPSNKQRKSGYVRGVIVVGGHDRSRMF